jgi:hypothetical protein
MRYGLPERCTHDDRIDAVSHQYRHALPVQSTDLFRPNLSPAHSGLNGQNVWRNYCQRHSLAQLWSKLGGDKEGSMKPRRPELRKKHRSDLRRCVSQRRRAVSAGIIVWQTAAHPPAPRACLRKRAFHRALTARDPYGETKFAVMAQLLAV